MPSSVSFTKRISTGDYEFEEVTLLQEYNPAYDHPVDVTSQLRQAAFNALALKVKAKIDAEQPPVAANTPDLDDPFTEEAPPAEEKPKRKRRTKAQIEADKKKAEQISDPFAEDEDNTPAALDEELDAALAKDADPEKGPFDDDEEDEVLIHKATNKEVRAALNRVATEVSIDAANGILGQFKKARVADCKDPEECGAIVQAAEKLLKGK